MRAVSLLYHDVVEDADWDSSGFTGPGTAKYKMSRPEFEAHLAAIDRTNRRQHGRISTLAHDLANSRETTASSQPLPFLLTFDDGGVSAVLIASLLERYGWRGHFFVTAAHIGAKGFLTPEQIRGLRTNGHVIGSHSFSHPTRMSHCSREELSDEWSRSVNILSDILAEPVDTASVPGGYYSEAVAETAAAAGIRILLNSEPTTAIHSVNGCLVVGRYNIFRGTPPRVSGDLVSIQSSARDKQWLYWNLKKVLKKSAGRPYLAARQWLLRKG
jgi:peptidoglycan/xylan/chitin deacetylase (PgdA/CDA1 family)